jgi:hypothetical protein
MEFSKKEKPGQVKRLQKNVAQILLPQASLVDI